MKQLVVNLFVEPSSTVINVDSSLVLKRPNSSNVFIAMVSACISHFHVYIKNRRIYVHALRTYLFGKIAVAINY